MREPRLVNEEGAKVAFSLCTDSDLLGIANGYGESINEDVTVDEEAIGRAIARGMLKGRH